MVKRRGSSGFRYSDDSTCAEQITRRYTHGHTIYFRSPKDFSDHEPHEFNDNTLLVIDYCSPPNVNVEDTYFTFEQLALADVVLVSTGRLRILCQVGGYRKHKKSDPFQQMRFQRTVVLQAEHCTPRIIEAMSRFQQCHSVWLASENPYKNLANDFRSEDHEDYAKLFQFAMLAFPDAADARLYENAFRVTQSHLLRDLKDEHAWLVFALRHLRDMCINMDAVFERLPDAYIEPETRCAVCYEDWADTPRKRKTTLLCEHIFHTACIASLDKCPLCKASLLGSRFNEERAKRKERVLKRNRDD